MHEHLLLRSAVETLLRVLERPFETTAGRFRFVDFLIQDDRGTRIALYAADGLPDAMLAADMRSELAQRADAFASYWCLVADPHTPDEAADFADAMKIDGADVRVVDMPALPAALGQDHDLDVSTMQGVKDVRLAAFVMNLAKHGLVPREEIDAGGPRRLLANLIAYGRTRVPLSYHTLTRQFPHATVGQLLADPGDLRTKLGVGTNVRPVTVVLSDLKNFSKLVHAVHPSTLNEMMGRYYLLARDLVWKYHGVLDKFIGDAVLAIFNYPQVNRAGAADAVHFALDLIAVGEQVTGDLLGTINDLIETGTRIGVASGELWTIDIGYEDLEVSFVGDVINLAARLEAAAEVNTLLVDNITFNLMGQTAPGFQRSLNATETRLSPEMAKGQSNPIRAWKIERPKPQT